MELKRFEKNMVNEIVSLFRETVLTINVKDYSEDQVKAWAGNSQTMDEWADRLEKSLAYVGLMDEEIVGFGNLSDNGLIDLLFVHKNHQAEGIGSMIVNQLEADAVLHNINHLTTEASITAKAFFLAHGYQVQKEQSKFVAGVQFINYKMSKILSGVMTMTSPIKSQINTIFVHVSDLKKSAAWYAGLLGQTYDPAEVSDPVYNMKMNHYTGLTLDAGPEGKKKVINPSPYPLFNFHTDDIHASFEFVANVGFQIESDIVEFDDFSFFTVKDPDNHIIMVCTG